MSFENVDYVTLTDGKDQEMRGYLERTVKDGLIYWAWSDNTLIIPIHRIASISMHEE